MNKKFNIGQKVVIMDQKPVPNYIVGIIEIEDNKILYATSYTKKPISTYELVTKNYHSDFKWRTENEIGSDIEDLKEKVFKGFE